MSFATSPISPSKPPRWWPGVAIFILALMAFAWIWLGGSDDRQQQVMRTMAVVLITAPLLALWALFAARFSRRVRLAIAGSLAGLVILGAGLFRIEGMSGDLVPRLAFRFAGEPDYAERTEASSEVRLATSPDDYPQFLGPNRDGKVTSGFRLARDWQAQAPREVWRHPVGAAWSSFAVVGNAAVTQEQRGDQEMVVRYELATGKEVWNHGDTARFDTAIGGVGPRSTPTIYRGRVYSLGATGILNALDLADGTRLWTHNLLREHGATSPEWGKSSSPLVITDPENPERARVVVSAGGPGGQSLVAYDAATGELAWSAGDDASGYSSPQPARLGGVEQVLIFNANSLVAHAPSDGRVLWREPWQGERPNVAQPLILDADHVFFSSGYGYGGRLLRITQEPGAGDKLGVETVWESRRLKSKFANMVLHGGTIYGLDDGVLVALDPATGERLWKRGRYGHGQIVLIDGLLLIQAEDGSVVLVEPSPEEHRELARLPALDDKTWNPPAPAGRYLLVRNHREAVCYELPERSASAESSWGRMPSAASAAGKSS